MYKRQGHNGMVIIWIILGALLLWEIQSVWYAKHWDEELFVSLAFSRKSTVRGEKMCIRDRCACGSRTGKEKSGG